MEQIAKKLTQYFLAHGLIKEDNAEVCQYALYRHISRAQYANNEFFHNGTAVLLKSVPAESPLSFPGSVFEDNDTDIDNRCGREVNISQTTFR